MHGPVYAAGDDGMAAEVATWNVAVQHTPAIAVGATCAADVAAAVSWAAARGLGVAVQATGHGPVRNAAGSVMITTRRMQGLSIDPERRVARVEAGVKWIRVLEAAAEFGLAGLCGSSSDVGVIGYTLGGGMGSLGRKHGFSADHVRTVEIVTADGRLHRVCAENEPELFWAVRGGKGNFGIVTALEIELVPVDDAVRRRHLLRRSRRPRRAARLPRVGARRCRRRSAPPSRSCGCRTWRSCRRRCAGRPSSTCGTPTPATTSRSATGWSSR